MFVHFKCFITNRNLLFLLQRLVFPFSSGSLHLQRIWIFFLIRIISHISVNTYLPWFLQQKYILYSQFLNSHAKHAFQFLKFFVMCFIFLINSKFIFDNFFTFVFLYFINMHIKFSFRFFLFTGFLSFVSAFLFRKLILLFVEEFSHLS